MKKEIQGCGVSVCVTEGNLELIVIFYKHKCHCYATAQFILYAPFQVCLCVCASVGLYPDSLMHENNPSLGRLLIWSAACRCRTQSRITD